ncbi:hypothetical protein Zm00014a_042680 [Zea mays]|nr:hypothetical protein Zm00014a_042680 [Zea mays]
MVNSLSYVIFYA